jgi:peptidoglycan lytic transglycosylase
MTDVFQRNALWARIAHLMASGATTFALAACANGNMATRVNADRGVAFDARPEAQAANSAPRTGSAPAPKSAPARASVLHTGIGYSAVGLASWYGGDFHGRLTADGETFDMNSLTAAHPTLPLPCNVRVTNLANRRSLVVRVNDRGPYVGHRVIDVSAKTAKLLGFYDHGLAKVKVEYVGRAPRKNADAGQATFIE